MNGHGIAAPSLEDGYVVGGESMKTSGKKSGKWSLLRALGLRRGHGGNRTRANSRLGAELFEIDDAAPPTKGIRRVQSSRKTANPLFGRKSFESLIGTSTKHTTKQSFMNQHGDGAQNASNQPSTGRLQVPSRQHNPPSSPRGNEESPYDLPPKKTRGSKKSRKASHNERKTQAKVQYETSQTMHGGLGNISEHGSAKDPHSVEAEGPYDIPPKPPPRPSLSIRFNKPEEPPARTTKVSYSRAQARAVRPGKTSGASDEVPPPPPRPSLELGAGASVRRGSVTQSVEVAEIIEEVAKCSTEQLASPEPPATLREKRATPSDEASGRRRDEHSRRPASTKPASRPQSQSHEVGRSKSSMPSSSTRHGEGSATQQQQQQQQQPRQHLRQQQQQQSHRKHTASTTRKTEASSASSADGGEKRRRSSQQRARDVAQSRLDFMNSSTDVEELAERRREAAADRRRSKDKSSTSGSSRAESRRPVKDAPPSAPTPTKQRSVETPPPSHEPEGIRVPRITDSSRVPATHTSMSGVSGAPQSQPQPQQRKRAQRQGTGKWTSGASVASSIPSHSDDDAAHQDKSTTITRKRGGTGRWDGGDRRRSVEDGRDRRWSVSDEVVSGGGDAPTAPTARRAEGERVEDNEVLASSLVLAEMAWRELASYRECGADEVAHESQVVVDEGDEDKVPAWRIEQIHEKKKERLMRMTPRQRKREKRVMKRLIAQQRQIESLVSSYCPTEC